MMAAGTSSTAKLVIDGSTAKAITWIMNKLKKVKGRPMLSDSHPQNRRPMPLKIEMVLTMSAAVNASTPVNFCANGEATEISAAPAVTFNARRSHRKYHLGLRRASGKGDFPTERGAFFGRERGQTARANAFRGVLYT